MDIDPDNYISSHWKLCTDFTIVQAALIIAGYDPESYDGQTEHDIKQKAFGYMATRTALFNAVRSGALTATHLEYEYESDGFQQREYIDVYATTISSADLDAFLKAKGHHCEFFAGATGGLSAPWTPDHPLYPRKLDAAVQAWTAVATNRQALRGKSPKQALEKWLTEHAEELGLLNKDGKPNRSGIEDICKVANWKPEGGAVPTPTSEPEEEYGYGGFQPVRREGPRQGFRPVRPATAPKSEPVGPRETFSTDLDDEIPF